MIPILYSKDTTVFSRNGLGRLSDAISCNIIEERNGQYNLEMVYPVEGMHYSDIQHSCYIFAKPGDGLNNQLFQIYKITKPINGHVKIMANHISYQLSHIPCGPFTAANAAQALQGLKDNSLENNPFTFWTNISTTATYTQDVPASIRSRMGGVKGSILDVYGGEFGYDNRTVKLYAHRGTDRGVVLNYGKNITDINQEENIENCVTGCCPFWKGEEGLVTLTEKVVYSTNANLYPYHRTEVVDFSSDFQTMPTEAQLRARAQAYINGKGIPKVNITVSFVALWQTEEYKNLASLERVYLCDTVTVYFEKLGISAQAKVIKTDYDVLKERYRSIEIGAARSSLTSQVVDIFEEFKAKPTADAMEAAINSATNLISGGLGGYVILKKNADGKPEEILIMDTDDVTTATNVIRMNKNGIGFSTTGYNGPFTTAWTIDGRFVADFITAGTLRAIDIEGVNITGSSISSTEIKSTGTGTELYMRGAGIWGKAIGEQNWGFNIQPNIENGLNISATDGPLDLIGTEKIVVKGSNGVTVSRGDSNTNTYMNIGIDSNDKYIFGKGENGVYLRDVAGNHMSFGRDANRNGAEIYGTKSAQLRNATANTYINVNEGNANVVGATSAYIKGGFASMNGGSMSQVFINTSDQTTVKSSQIYLRGRIFANSDPSASQTYVSVENSNVIKSLTYTYITCLTSLDGSTINFPYVSQYEYYGVANGIVVGM